MEVKEAVQIAKKWVYDVLSDEHPINIGLEEVKYDDAKNLWRVTVGFSRPWDVPQNTSSIFQPPKDFASTPQLLRSYRIVTVKEPDGAVESMTKSD